MLSTTVYLRILVGDTLSPLYEFRGVRFRPPIFQIAMRIELAALIVETMRQLVADGGAGIADNWARRPF